MSAFHKNRGRSKKGRGTGGGGSSPEKWGQYFGSGYLP